MKDIFSILLVIAFGGILSQTFLDFGPIYNLIFLLIVGFIPLVVYKIHLSKKDTLTNIEIDSIYYFGFLITLMTLGATALRLVFYSIQIETVASQFGLGLTATGFGLWSRLSLQSKSVTADASEELLQRQLNHISSITERFSETVQLFRTLREEAIIKSQDAISGVSAVVIEKITSELSQPLNILKTDLTNLSSSISDFNTKKIDAIKKSTLSLSESLPIMSNAIETLSGELNKFKNELSSPSEKLHFLNNTLDIANETASKIPVVFNNINLSGSEMTNTLNLVSNSLISFSKIDLSQIPQLIQSYSALSKEISNIAQSISVLPSDLTTEKEKFKSSLEALSNQMQLQADELNQTSELLGNAFKKIAISIHTTIEKISI